LEELAQETPELAEKVAQIRQQMAEQIETPLKALKDHRQQVRDAYLALISNMSFQDLTGQTLKKVILFVENLQDKLIRLISRQGALEQRPAEAKSSHVPMEGPDAKAEHQPLSQTDVDKTLADLGF
jgi:chemotaxis regulatin CheY-phosphate phosphatase CheZ